MRDRTFPKSKGSALLLLVLGIALLASACAPGPTARLQEQLDLGAKYVSELDYEQALIAYTAAIELDPKNSDLYVARGGVYSALEQYDEAVGDYTEAIALNDQNAPAYVARGDVYLLLLDYTSAVLDFDSAAALGEDVDQRLEDAIRMGMELERAQGGISAVLHWLETIHRQALDIYQELALQVASLEALQAACASGDDEAVFALLKQIDEQGTFDELSDGEDKVQLIDPDTQMMLRLGRGLDEIGGVYVGGIEHHEKYWTSYGLSADGKMQGKGKTYIWMVSPDRTETRRKIVEGSYTDDKMDGVWKSVEVVLSQGAETDTLEAEWTCANGVPNGPARYKQTSSWEEGIVTQEEELTYVDGVPNGPTRYKSVYSDGQWAEGEGIFKDGQPAGIWEHWDSDGSRVRTDYDRGGVVSYYEDGYGWMSE